MDYDDEKMKKLIRVFEDKLTIIASATGYNEQEIGSPEYKKFEMAWDKYVGSLGIERQGSSDKSYIADQRLSVPDPLYATGGEWLLMSEQTAYRILMLGAP